MKVGTGTGHDIRESIHIHPAPPEIVQRAFTGQFTQQGHDHHHYHEHDHGDGHNDGHGDNHDHGH